MGTDRLTWRRLGVLMRYLPRESAYVQAVLGPVAQWSTTDHLVASLIDAVQGLSYYTQIAASNFRLTDKPKPPKPLPRPGDKSDKDKRPGRVYTRAEMREILDRRRAGVIETEAKQVQ